jgi:hypothetical protein
LFLLSCSARWAPFSRTVPHCLSPRFPEDSSPSGIIHVLLLCDIDDGLLPPGLSSNFRALPGNGSVTLVWRTNLIGKTGQSVLSQKLSQFAGPNLTSFVPGSKSAMSGRGGRCLTRRWLKRVAIQCAGAAHSKSAVLARSLPAFLGNIPSARDNIGYDVTLRAVDLAPLPNLK